MSAGEDVESLPTVRCPKCGQQQTDYDGFGFLACIPGCGYCTHPSASGSPPKCGICGETV